MLLLSPAALPAAAAPGETFDRTCQDFSPVQPPAASWATERLQPERAHTLATGRGVRIAVIDTAADIEDMPVFDRASISVVNYTGYTERIGQGDDVDCQHGTRVTSLIVGGPVEGTDWMGIAPDAEVLVMRSLQRSPPRPDEQDQSRSPEPIAPVVDAIRAATAEGVDIINISQAGTYDPDYADAVADALDAGIVVVAAAGNGAAAAQPPYPAAFPGVIAVGATGPNDDAPPFSQSHPDLKVTVAAPGVQVLVAQPAVAGKQSWEVADGTSFAAPQVSGVVALMLEREPDLTPAEVAERLRRTADPGPDTVPDPQTGWGVVNPWHALTDVVGEPAPKGPTAEPTPAGDYRDRARPDHTRRNLSIGLAGGAIAAVAVAAVLAASLPAGRRRRWLPPRR